MFNFSDIVSKSLLRLMACGMVFVGLSAAAIAVSGLRDTLHPADVGIVLGNEVYADGTPSHRLRARLDRSADLYAARYFPWVIVSGGLGREGYNESDVMQHYLIAHGIPKERIIVDPQGDNTYLTARNAAFLMRRRGMKSALVISQYFHLPRARLALRRFGVAPVYASHARYFECRDVYALLREVAGYGWYLVRRYQ